MALTSAERKRRYREKQKLENNEEYKLKEQLKNKKYYASKIKHIDVKDIDIAVLPKNETIEEFIYLEPIKKRINPINKSKLNNNTIQLYLKTMKYIYYTHHKSELTDDTDILNVLSNKPYNLQNINTQFGFIKTNIYDIIKTNKKDDIRNLYSVITRIKSYAIPVKKMYPYILNYQNIYNDKRANKVIDTTTQQKLDTLSFEKEDIINNLNKHSNLSSNEKLIYCLLTLFPTRRPVDYRKMLIIQSDPPNQSKLKYEDKHNYYYNKMFYFNITKNKKVQKFNISDNLNNIIQANISDKKNNEYLLSNNNKQFTQNELSKLIMETFFKIYGVSISAVEIRRLYATHLKSLFDKKLLSEKEHRDISEMMNHNYEENKKYSY
jgi:hypothetical protein